MSASAFIEIRLARRALDRARERLEQRIVAAREGETPLSLRKIGDAAGMTSEGVRQLIARRSR